EGASVSWEGVGETRMVSLKAEGGGRPEVGCVAVATDSMLRRGSRPQGAAVFCLAAALAA
ncbi:hypothetical protein MNEG_15197, partial [Monoraphidium neglectum]